MSMTRILLASAAAVAMVANAGVASAEMIGEGLTMYMQMGGNPGDGATLARQTGAAQAAEAFGVDLKEQFSAWAPETMINQFKEAVAAKPDCIEIMGHPGGTAFDDLVKDAVDQGIVVTSGNSPMTDLQAEFGSKGFGYAGVDLYVGGQITANYMIAPGPEVGRRGDGLWRLQPGRAWPLREGPRRHAGEGRPQGRPAGDHPGSQQRRLARRSRFSPPTSRPIPTSRRSAPSTAASPACSPIR